jgi:hypothetical protein
MVQNKKSSKEPHLNFWVLLKSIPYSDTPDSRWGAVGILLSIAFFFFGLAIAAVSFYGTNLWGGILMGLVIGLGAMGFIVFCITIKVGYEFWKRGQEEYKERQKTCQFSLLLKRKLNSMLTKPK